jgi:phosphoribosylformylglycinamidine synthase
MKFGVVVFTGSNCDADTEHALGTIVGAEVQPLWHADETVQGVDCVVLPGGFAYGDYLRAGAIARFSPVMRAVQRHAEAGGLVLGICNGFQVLVEAGLLPGALLRNAELEFRCRWVHLRVERAGTPFTGAYRQGEVIRMPIAHGEGRYYADPATLDRLEANGQVIFRYVSGDGPGALPANPNGSARDIAGIVNERGNVLGLMPHPERCCEPLVGGADGVRLFQSLTRALAAVS